MYQKILVPLDGSELSECVLPHVEAIAKGCSAPSVVLLRVAEPFYMPTSGEYAFTEKEIARMEAERKKVAGDYLAQVVGRIKLGGVQVKAEVLGGPAAESIAGYAARNGVDLIIIATHGRSGVSRWVWGSVADRVLRSACVPVFMIRAPGCAPGA